MRSSWSGRLRSALREVGRELGVNHETLRNWVNAAKRAEQAAAGPAAPRRAQRRRAGGAASAAQEGR